MTRQCPFAITSILALLVTAILPGPLRAQTQTSRNILMIIADDVGVDMIEAYQPYEGSIDVPRTPEINKLAEQGVQFLNTWSNPVCATTRATIQTGRYSYRTGVWGAKGTLPDEEFSIPEILRRDPELSYTTATFGKWGLTEAADDGAHPIRTGYDLFKGDPDHQLDTYSDWQRYTAHADTEDPDPSCDFTTPAWRNNPLCIEVIAEVAPGYATEQNVEDTLDWIDGLPPEQPWFAVLSFNAAHSPWHAPPTDPSETQCPHAGGLDCAADVRSCYVAMIEVMDCHIGRLLAGLPEDDKLESGNTTIMFLGDNGTPGGMALPPFRTEASHVKQSVYEGGINVPLIIAGAGVVNKHRVSQALVNTADLFMTVLGLAGLDSSCLPQSFPDVPDDGRYNGQAWEHDSFSLMRILDDTAESIREYAYARGSWPRWAIRNPAGYKLVRYGAQVWEFYDLNTSPFEYVNLVAPIDPDTPVINPLTGKLLERGLLDAEAEAAYFDLSQKLEIMDSPTLPPANLDLDADAVADDEDNCDALVNQDQRDTDEDGYGNACDADYDNDGDVDADDFAMFQAAFPSTDGEPEYDPDIDCDGDGSVGLADYGCFGRGEGLPPGPSGLACAGSVPCIADADGDGVRDTGDNCKFFANPDQLDTSEDGYGNACDADYDNDGDVDSVDAEAFQAAHPSSSGDPEYDEDMDCDGSGGIGVTDFGCFMRGQGSPPGPSGLICAGTVPCLSSQ